jgi:hypothetical protein
MVPGERRDFSKSALDAVGYRTLNFAELFWLIALAAPCQEPRAPDTKALGLCVRETRAV